MTDTNSNTQTNSSKSDDAFIETLQNKLSREQITAAINVLDIASLSRDVVQQLKIVFDTLILLQECPSRTALDTKNLIEVGRYLASDMYDIFETERQNRESDLAELREASS